MADTRARQWIAVEAARLMYERVESEYYTAKRKAAQRIGVNFRRQPYNLPSNREIRDQIQAFARMYEGERRLENLRDMRIEALRLMRALAAFRPKLIGSVSTGHIREGSDIDIHLFSDGASAITDILDSLGYDYQVERKHVLKHNVARVFTHVHIQGRWNFELTIYGRDKATYVFKSSITGKAIESMTVKHLEAFIAQEYPDVDLEGLDDDSAPVEIDRYQLWALLLAPLENVKQNPQWHPEGDALYHSLQAFELARERYPYDEEMMVAALLHDVGKAIDPADHVEAGLEALGHTLTERERFLIAHHMEAAEYQKRMLPQKRRAALEASEWFDDLMALREIDNDARRRGVDVCSPQEAIEHLRGMSEEMS